MASGDVPRIPPTVAVGVREVVGRPGIGREDDRNAVSPQSPRPDDERGVPHAAVGGGCAEEVEAARPIARAYDSEEGRAVPMRAPVDPNRSRLRDAAGLHVLVARSSRRLVGEDLQAELPGVRGDAQLGRLAGRVAAPGEGRVDSLNAHDRSVLAAVWTIGAVDPASDGEPRDVRARLRRRSRLPGQRAPAGVEVPRRSPQDCRPTSAGAHHVRRDDLHAHDRSPRHPEAHGRCVAESVTVRAHGGEEAAVAGKGGRAVRDTEIRERGRGCGEDACSRENGSDHVAVMSLTVSLRSNDAGHNSSVDTGGR